MAGIFRRKKEMSGRFFGWVNFPWGLIFNFSREKISWGMSDVEMSGVCLEEIFLGLIFHKECAFGNVQRNCPGACPDPRARLQSLCSALMISATMVNTQTDTHTQTGFHRLYMISSVPAEHKN